MATILYTSLVDSSFSYSINLIAVFMAALYSLYIHFVKQKSVRKAGFKDNINKGFGGYFLLLMWCVSDLLLIELSLTEKEEVDGFGAFPRICKCFVRWSWYVTSNQRIHGLGCHISRRLPSSCNLSHLGVKNALFIRVDFKSCQNVDLFD